MSKNAVVVVFPSAFARNKLNHLEANIKKILRIRNQEFQKIKRDGTVIVVEANDPVFASSSINLLFGIKKVAIAKQTKNDFNAVVSEITKTGSNLLLKGERFYVQVEGKSSGYTPKDIELAATSSLIEKTTKLGAKPGTEEKHDKLLFTFLTKANAYVCIFIDEGNGGIPNNSQNAETVCAIYDELSAVSCLETIKEGYDAKLIVCYKQKSELTSLVKILNHILPRMVKSEINIEFYNIPIKDSSSKNLLFQIECIREILIQVAKSNKIKRISLALSPLIFPLSFVETSLNRVFKNNLIPLNPISGLDNEIFETAIDIGLAKYLSRIEKLGQTKFSEKLLTKTIVHRTSKATLNTRKVVSVTVGPNNVHEILDSLKVNH